MLENYFKDIAYKIDYHRNKYGDWVFDKRTQIYCRFRYGNTLRQVTHQTIMDSDSQIWFSPNENINEANIIEFENKFYQIEDIIKAKKLGSTIIQFVKCELKRVEINIS